MGRNVAILVGAFAAGLAAASPPHAGAVQAEKRPPADGSGRQGRVEGLFAGAQQLPAFLTLRSGSTYTLLPVGAGGVQGGQAEFLIQYVSATSELPGLERAARELLDWHQSDASKYEVVMVSAILDVDLNSGHYRAFVLRFHRAGGEWKRQNFTAAPEVPAVGDASLLQGFYGFHRDARAERAAVKVIQDFVAAADSRDVDATWELMSSVLRASFDRNRLREGLAGLPEVLARAELWRLAKPRHRNLPQGSYVTVKYKGTASVPGGGSWFDTVTVAKENGVWRVVGWDSKPGG